MGIKAFIARKAAMTAMKLRVKKPTICVIGGTLGMAVSSVLACVQTVRKLDDVLDKHNEEMAKIREAREKSEAGELDLKKEGIDLKQATTGVYLKTAGRMAKVYWAPLIMMAGSAALILYGHHILQSRHALTLAAYTALEDRFKTYRNRVKDVIGDEKEELLYHGAEKKLVTVLDKDGNEVTEEKTVIVDQNKNLGEWSFIFDAANAPHTWSRKPGENCVFLTMQQKNANQSLLAKGYVSLNQVLESLGMDMIKEGFFIGWILNKGSEPPVTIDFGITAVDSTDSMYFGGGLPDYILNFNCTQSLEAYFAKKQVLKCRTRPKVFVRRKGCGEK